MTEDDVHYSADGEPLAVQARRLVVENQRLTEKLRGGAATSCYVVARGTGTGTYDDAEPGEAATSAAPSRDPS
jgi:hypothetical protein